MQAQLAFDFDAAPVRAVPYRSDAERNYWEPLFRAAEAVMQKRRAWAAKARNQPQIKGMP
jgi:hypothetical protein